MKSLATWGALALGGVCSFSLIANAAEEPAKQIPPKSAAFETASIDGPEISPASGFPATNDLTEATDLGQSLMTVHVSRATTRVVSAGPDRPARMSTS
jgi:hypothetical protein